MRARVREHFFRASAWGLGLRVSARVMGLLSTLVLARLLTPDDFGVVAIALLVVVAVEVLGEGGQKLALIRLTDGDREYCDSAWTLSVITGVALALIVFSSAPLGTTLFAEPRAVAVIQLLSLRPLLGGLESMGSTLFRRELDFRREFYVLGAQRLFTFVVTIGFAIVFQNYWALAGGQVVGRLGSTVLSFAMHPYRPRFRLSKLRSLWGFSAWILAKQLGNFMSARLDHILIGSLNSASSLGYYTIANDLGTAVTEEIRIPITAAIYPVLAKAQADVAFVTRAYLSILALIATITVATSIGIGLVAEDMVHVVLGSKWLAVAPLIVWLAAGAGVFSIGATAFSIFELLGRADISAKVTWLQLGAIGLAMGICASLTKDTVAFAITRFCLQCAFTVQLLSVLTRLLAVTWRDIFRELWRPAMAGATMALVVTTARSYMAFAEFERLALSCLMGVIAYLASLTALWWLSGRPDGAEKMVILFLGRALSSPRPT